jgi:hypothetical protein
VYQEFIWNDKYGELALQFYGSPPKTIRKVVDNLPNLLEKYRETSWYNEGKSKRLRTIIQSANSEIGCLTPKVKENIELLDNGGIEASHQSVVMGGPCYILNKAATASIIAQLAQIGEQSVAPFFFVADYDVVQPELTNIRTPLMGQGGNLISIPVPEGYEYSPVSIIPLPSNDWYYEVEESIRTNYHPMFKGLEGSSRKLFEERLEHALSIIRSGFFKSHTLDQWATKIMGTLMNLEGNLGIPLIPTSNKEIKHLMVEGMEFRLSNSNRETFVDVQNKSTKAIRDLGYEPGSGERSKDYVPFYYECPDNACKHSRTELSYDTNGKDAILKGRCPTCGEQVEITTDAKNPDLKEYAEYLSPRVDSRQIILDKVLPVLAHIGGAGETAYYAQVIPIAAQLSIPFPQFVKYPRAYFNTPYNEELGAILFEKGFPVLHQSEMFKYMGGANKARRKNKPEKMNDSWKAFEQFLRKTHTELNEALETILIKLDTPEGRSNEELVGTRLEIERYLSWVYGQYTDEKFGQESSWSWIDWAINSGLHDLFGPYDRTYDPELNNGSTVFINFMI